MSYSHPLRLLVILVCLLTPASPAVAEPPESALFLHYWSGPFSSGMDDMMRIFSDTHPEMPVTAQAFSHELFKRSIMAMLESNDPPDIISYWAGERTAQLVDLGLIAPLDDVWREQSIEKRFPPVIVDLCTYNGHRYAVPLTRHVVGFFYDKRLFNRLGLTPPATYSEFKALCATIKAAGVSPVALGSRDRWPAQYWFDFLLLTTAGAPYRERLAAGKASWTDPEVRRVFDLWAELIDAGYFHPAAPLLDWAEAARLLSTGDAAMTLMGTWPLTFFEQHLGLVAGRDFDFFPFPPVDPDVARVAIGPVDVALVPAHGRVEAGKAVCAYLTDPGPQQAISLGSGAFAPTLAVSPAIYSPLSRRIYDTTILASPAWATPFDLAWPSAPAEVGLKTFAAFLERPSARAQLLKETAKSMENAFAGRN